MADHGEEGGHGQQKLRTRQIEPGSRDYNCSYAFGGVEQQSRNPQSGRFASYIGCADIPAAARAHIFMSENPNQQVAKRD